LQQLSLEDDMITIKGKSRTTGKVHCKTEVLRKNVHTCF